MSDDKKRIDSLNTGLGLLWAVVLILIFLLVKAGVFDALFK